MNERFRDRQEAGRLLAERLGSYANRDPLIVLALPRGGVPVAVEVARALSAPMDVIVVRKLGTPGQPELAMGAIAMGGVRVLNRGVVDALDVDGNALREQTERERAELVRRERAFRGERPFPPVEGHTVILVDDGLATGSTMRAAIEIVKQHDPREVVVAVPVAPPSTVDDLSRLVDDMVVVATPEPFYAIGLWYDDFHQLRDEDVRGALEQNWSEAARG